MVNNTVNKNFHPRCFQCGAELVFVSEEIVQPEGMRYPQTNTTYRCSNEECQKRKDKDKLDRDKQKQIRLNAEEDRAKKTLEKRKLGQKSKMQEG